MKINFEKNDIIHIVCDTLLPYKTTYEDTRTSPATQAWLKTRREINEAGRDVLRAFFVKNIDKLQAMPRDEYAFIFCAYYHGTTRVIDNDHVDTEPLTNLIVRNLCFIPDDSTSYVTPIVTAVIEGDDSAFKKWLKANEDNTMGKMSHTEVFIVNMALLLNGGLMYESDTDDA